ncbi:MAG: hypothetical protein ACR2FM_05125 [Candidatus Saccharimonadales bacterium]
MVTKELTLKDINRSIKGLHGLCISRFADIDKHFVVIDNRFANINEHFVKIDERFAQIDKRFVQINERFKEIDIQFEQIGVRFEQVDTQFGQVNTRFAMIEIHLKELKHEVYELRHEQRETSKLSKHTYSRVLGIESDIKEIYDRLVALEQNGRTTTKIGV